MGRIKCQTYKTWHWRLKCVCFIVLLMYGKLVQFFVAEHIDVFIGTKLYLLCLNFIDTGFIFHIQNLNKPSNYFWRYAGLSENGIRSSAQNWYGHWLISIWQTQIPLINKNKCGRSGIYFQIPNWLTPKVHVLRTSGLNFPFRLAQKSVLL